MLILVAYFEGRTEIGTSSLCWRLVLRVCLTDGERARNGGERASMADDVGPSSRIANGGARDVGS